MMGIKCLWDCPSCGSIIKNASPFWDEKTRKNIASPKACACGRKSGFKLLDFEKCLYTVMPKGTKIVDRKGIIIAEYEDKEAEEKESMKDPQGQEDPQDQEASQDPPE